ncbi:hypothetical protein E3T28_02920 [Cryobacterium sinapicolor]|uniref:Uncharacterized protein n=1 Tax=Cryobacterium sinapicolor TaxID=1259236 RepID=A0ABY2JFD0_9MICO|nr:MULTISPECIES: hypothetical protein [Cryobacterium]TFC83220.1 hypothetical protein E3O67_15260 [Cryobacterium sp. TMT3-29-2]TFD04401.1 hypothetical protein E3T28_02920 [Cryobacterium sinapicolor]
MPVSLSIRHPASGWRIRQLPIRGIEAVLELIRSEGNVRLEQERIPWAQALAQLKGVAAGSR